ncbi:MAG: helicase, RecD/TraA family [Firmicutes bacterium]|nr:helicase, RecD/TraA family [Bacillota bacterium]
MEAGLEKVEGIVETVIFENSEGSFTVFKIRPAKERGLINVTANAPAPLVGEQVELHGEWITHAKFGDQFKAQLMKHVAPTSLSGIERFLASGVIKGIGAAMAKRLVDKFGLETLEVIENSPRRLQEISGIGKKKAADIHEAYSVQSELREVMLFLETHGVSSAYAGKIFTKYSSFSIDVIKKDPYRLAREVDGIGFRTADQIAASIGVEKFSEDRISAGIDFALLQIANAGHCCVPEQILIEQTAKLILVNHNEVAITLKKLLKEDQLCTEEIAGTMLIYPRHLYHAEKNVAKRLLYLKDKAQQIASEDAMEKVHDWEETAGITLAEQQRQAVISALEHGVLVLTGGPGTGKTTVVKGMIAVLEEQGLQILLGAPTGRAAKRLSETTGRKAVTVHRLLESTGGDGGLQIFARDSDEPLEADVVILDEVSMMDISLMNHFLEAIAKGCRVILVGDVDQLPAVGPGAVLKDILRSDTVPVVRLTEVFRQAGESMIVMNAHAINRGLLPDYKTSEEFQFREINDSNEVAIAIVMLCTTELQNMGFDIRRDVQVLTPMHRLDCGVENLNKLLQNALNPESENKPKISNRSETFRLGDKVMQMRNNYTKNVFNGDIGFIVEIDAEKTKVRYPDNDAIYEKNELAELHLAYAMSVHKSQGSEYPIVVMPLIPGHHIMLQRNLLYTAVTRAKTRVILVGTKTALSTAVMNDRTKKRYSLLAERLRQEIGC